MEARLSHLYNEYERQFRDLFLLDSDSLRVMAHSGDPDLPIDASKSDCANSIMEHSRLGRRIAELEQEP